MSSALLKAILGVLIASGAKADAIEPLDGAFLEYLANLEADHGDWTLLTKQADVAAPAESAAAEPAAPPPGRTEASGRRKPTAEAAKPAVENR